VARRRTVDIVLDHEREGHDDVLAGHIGLLVLVGHRDGRRGLLKVAHREAHAELGRRIRAHHLLIITH
jgi:hypothetical protein